MFFYCIVSVRVSCLVRRTGYDDFLRSFLQPIPVAWVHVSIQHPVLKRFKSWGGKAHLVNVKQ